MDFKPNKKFAEKFRDAINNQRENVEIDPIEEPGEIREQGSMNFFRQLVRQIVLNMIIKIDNLAIRLFINEPSP